MYRGKEGGTDLYGIWNRQSHITVQPDGRWEVRG